MKHIFYAFLLAFAFPLGQTQAQTATIGNFVWDDTNGDGIQDSGEPGIPNLAITLTGTDDAGQPVLRNTTTNANGNYLFPNLAAGTYVVAVASPGGAWVVTRFDPNHIQLCSDLQPWDLKTPPITLSDNEINMTWDAGFYRYCSFIHNIWEDQNGDGLFAVGEPGIPGIMATLTGTDGNLNSVTLTTLTDNYGRAQFNNLAPGTYKITSTAPGASAHASKKDQGSNDELDSDIDPGPLSSPNTTIKSGQVNGSIDAGFYFEAKIGDFVWHDLNGNGIQEPIEPGLASTPVSLAGTTGDGTPVLLNTSTDATGQYLFPTLQPGTYHLIFSNPSGGFVVTAINKGSSDVIDSDAAAGSLQTANNILTSGETDLTWDAGFYQPAAIGNFVWNDLDVDGIQDPAEPGIAGQTVHLEGTSGDGLAVSLTKTTDALGAFLFDNLTPGSYKLEFSYPAGCQTITQADQGGDDSTDSDANPKTRLSPLETLTSGETNLNYDAGFYMGTVLHATGSNCGLGEISAEIWSSINPPITYSWENNLGSTGNGTASSQTFSISVPESGVYTVTTTDALGCSATATATVNITPPFEITATKQNVGCFGETNGNIDLTVVSGAGPFAFTWSNGQTTEDLANLAAGVYTVTATDGFGCTVSLPTEIGQPQPFTLFIPNTTEITCLSPNATVFVSPSTNTMPFSWELSDGQFGSTSLPQFVINSITITGNYTITVTNNDGCTATGTFTVTQDANVPIAYAGPAITLTCDSPVATLDGTGSSVGPAFTYAWSTTNGNFISASNTLSPVVDAPGTYQLIVTNTANGCSAVSQTVVLANQDLPLITGDLETGLPCSGGDLTLSLSFPLNSQYLWTGPSNFSSNAQNPVVSNPGVYTVVVTAINGCTNTASVTVFPGPAIPQSDISVSNLPCTPGVLGAINLTPTFGTPPYTFNWSNGAATEDINNLTAGEYHVTVVDNTGCSYYRDIQVGQSQNTINLSLASIIPTSCLGNNDGAIGITVSNGAAPYTFQWIGPQGFTSTLEDISGLATGSYSITVTDATGCTKSTTINIPSPAAIAVPSNGISMIAASCYGASDGAINITPTGGTPPYTYDWSNNGPQNPDSDPQDVTGLSAGTYTVTITDAHGCSLVPSSFIVSQPADFTLTAVVTPIACGASNGGAIDLINTGTGNFTYQWSNANTTQDMSGIIAGIYTTTVTSPQGCTKTLTVELYEGAVIPQGNFAVTPESCESNSNDGAITITTLPIGATAPLDFHWEGANGYISGSQNIVNIPAGNYMLTISDNNGCQYRATVTVEKSAGNLAITAGVTTVHCNSADLNVNVSGGSPPYAYHWSDGSNTSTITYSLSGTYTVTVTDVTGCSKTASFSLTPPPGLAISGVITNPACANQGNGAIDLSVANGSGDYFYTWSNGNPTEDPSGLFGGSYCVTVTDGATGCEATACFNLAQPAQTTLALEFMQPTCWGGNDGSITVHINNAGAAPYTWVRQGPLPASGSSPNPVFPMTDLSAGFYCVTVTNAAGCTALACGTLGSPTLMVSSIEEVSNNCNFAVLRAQISGGVAPYTYSWQGPVALNTNTPVISAPVSGTYQVIIVDARGCSNTSSIVVTLANGGACGYITGVVAHDLDENCAIGAFEPPLAGWLVRAEGADTLYGVTDITGRYLVPAPLGTYKMSVIMPNNLWQVCPVMPQVTVNMSNDTAFGGNFPVQDLLNCPALTVTIGTGQLRRCFSNNYYLVNYCNQGTGVAENAYVDVILDPFLSYQTSSIASVDVGNNTRRFFLGDLNVGECGSFNIRVMVNCNATLGQTHCTEAHIYPDSVCNHNALWSGASLMVRSKCEDDSLKFIIKNSGTGNMNSIADYIVVEDAVMLLQAPLPQLNVGDSITLSYPANGSTWYIQVDQEAYHPYPTPVALAVEGCSTSGVFSTGFVNQFPLNDTPPPVDIDCTANTGSFDPNDKQGFPNGYGDAHDIVPGTALEYLIRFQNTGTDTAFTVQVVDTLSSWLDPATIQFGVSSHPYRYDLNGEGIVHFIFENILLPDSNINAAASNGFVKFSIKPRADVPLKSVIENTAAIYFDFNDPVFTNTTYHRINEKFINVAAWEPKTAAASIEVVPNPFHQETILTVKGLRQHSDLQLQVFDLQGNVLKTIDSTTDNFRLVRTDWPSGAYHFCVRQQGKVIGSGTLLVQ